MGRRFSDEDTVVQDPTNVEHKDPKAQEALAAAQNRPDGANHLENKPNSANPQTAEKRSDGKHELSEVDAPEVLGFAFPAWRKWMILSVIFIVQCSMNYNAAVYASGVDLLTAKFDISAQAARVGQCVFLISYAFGCELWAPWSEELGRWPTLQASLFLVNIWQVLAALAPNFGTVIVARFLGGISSAGGSVTLAMVADMWDPDRQQFAVLFVVFSSVFGSVIGPLVGPFIAEYLTWEWICWTQLIFGGFVQILHFFLVPETRSTVLLDREAKALRKAGHSNIYGPSELKEHRFSPREILTTWVRPFQMFFTEPIVLWCSLLSGFSDALIFTFMDAFTPVYKQWGITGTKLALTFVPVAIGYIIAYFLYLPPLMKQRKMLAKDSDGTPPEIRLAPLVWLAPLETIGLFGFAWTSLGPPHTHWIAPMIFSCLVGIANLAIYESTIDYMMAAYGPYSASATGGNGLARDFLAGVAAMYSTPFFTNIGGESYRYHLEWPTTILAIIAFFVTIPIFIFRFKGEYFRKRSKFAQTLAGQRKQKNEVGGAVPRKAVNAP